MNASFASPVQSKATSIHPADRLLDAVLERRTPACIGLDPVLERCPASIGGSADPTPVEKAVPVIERFCMEVIDAVAGLAPCIKVQSACFERYGHAGVAAMERIIRAAGERELIVIYDAKRGDIGISASHYAHASFPVTDGIAPAWVTVNPCFGEDGITPFLERGGAFALVRTSNPSSDVFQGLPMEYGETLAEAVAELIAQIGQSSEDLIGRHGFSRLGAVVAATKRNECDCLRIRMPQQVFLMPGYGAQGGTADDVRNCFNDKGLGAIITASRSVIYGFDRGESNWIGAVRDAAARFADEVGQVAGLR